MLKTFVEPIVECICFESEAIAYAEPGAGSGTISRE